MSFVFCIFISEITINMCCVLFRFLLIKQELAGRLCRNSSRGRGPDHPSQNIHRLFAGFGENLSSQGFFLSWETRARRCSGPGDASESCPFASANARLCRNIGHDSAAPSVQKAGRAMDRPRRRQHDRVVLRGRPSNVVCAGIYVRQGTSSMSGLERPHRDGGPR